MHVASHHQPERGVQRAHASRDKLVDSPPRSRVETDGAAECSVGRGRCDVPAASRGCQPRWERLRRATATCDWRRRRSLARWGKPGSFPGPGSPLLCHPGPGHDQACTHARGVTMDVSHTEVGRAAPAAGSPSEAARPRGGDDRERRAGRPPRYPCHIDPPPAVRSLRTPRGRRCRSRRRSRTARPAHLPPPQQVGPRPRRSPGCRYLGSR